MAHHTCANCGREFTSNRWECPYCGYNSCILSKSHTPHNPKNWELGDFSMGDNEYENLC